MSIQHSVESYNAIMEKFNNGIAAQQTLITRQRERIQELEQYPIKSTILLFTLAYIYGIFLGVWVCPK